MPAKVMSDCMDGLKSHIDVTNAAGLKLSGAIGLCSHCLAL